MVTRNGTCDGFLRQSPYSQRSLWRPLISFFGTTCTHIHQHTCIYTGGLVLNLGPARLEANYCVPLAWQPGDAVRKGLQIGLGISFL